MPIDYANAMQQPARQVLETAAAQAGVALLDVCSIVCSVKDCSTEVRDRQIYKDFGHITVSESHYLAPKFKEAIQSFM